jgi:hypothetical protein
VDEADGVLPDGGRGSGGAKGETGEADGVITDEDTGASWVC